VRGAATSQMVNRRHAGADCSCCHRVFATDRDRGRLPNVLMDEVREGPRKGAFFFFFSLSQARQCKAIPRIYHHRSTAYSRWTPPPGRGDAAFRRLPCAGAMPTQPRSRARRISPLPPHLSAAQRLTAMLAPGTAMQLAFYARRNRRSFRPVGDRRWPRV